MNRGSSEPTGLRGRLDTQRAVVADRMNLSG